MKRITLINSGVRSKILTAYVVDGALMRDAVLIRYEIGHRWSTCELWLGIETILSGEEGGRRLF